MVLQLFTIQIVHVMINSCKSTKAINSFQYVAIPSPRDVFARYGERVSNNGSFSCGIEGGSPQMVSATSVIDQMISAQNLIELDMSSQQKTKQ